MLERATWDFYTENYGPLTQQGVSLPAFVATNLYQDFKAGALYKWEYNLFSPLS